MEAKNLKAPIRHVMWSELERSTSGAHRSECPACDNGLLLVRRLEEGFACVDTCTTCGQHFIYDDETILGTRVLTLSELSVLSVMES